MADIKSAKAKAAKEVKETKEEKQVAFKCRFCGRSLSPSEMMVVARFFPPVVACRECEKDLQ